MSFAIADEEYEKVKGMTGTIVLNENMVLAQGQVLYKKSWQESKDANEPTDP